MNIRTKFYSRFTMIFSHKYAFEWKIIHWCLNKINYCFYVVEDKQ